MHICDISMSILSSDFVHELLLQSSNFVIIDYNNNNYGDNKCYKYVMINSIQFYQF